MNENQLKRQQAIDAMREGVSNGAWMKRAMKRMEK